MEKKSKQYKTLKDLQDFVDGDVDSPYEFIMILIIIINTVSLGIETSKNISEQFRNILFWIDQVCLYIFVAELIFKIVVYNKEFFRKKIGKDKYKWNKWNISDLLIVLVSLFSSLPYFTVLRVFRVFRSFKVIKAIRSLRIIKSLKIVNEFSQLRTNLKGLLKAIPGIIWTFCFLAVFAYVYAIIGTNIFCEDFPQYFGSLGTSILTLCQITTFDSWFSGIARPIIQIYSWAWVYFLSFAFIAASVIMNVIVGIIVDSMGRERDKEEKNNKNASQTIVTLESLSQQITELQKQIEELEKKD
jgi:voltage-gated sodium channel